MKVQKRNKWKPWAAVKLRAKRRAKEMLDGLVIDGPASPRWRNHPYRMFRRARPKPELANKQRKLRNARTLASFHRDRLAVAGLPARMGGRD